jgi:hypothetical protein
MAPLSIALIVLPLWWAWRRRVLRLGEWLMLLIGLVLMMRLGRFAPIFGIMAGPVVTATMPRLSDKPLSRTLMHVVMAIALLSFLWRVVEAFPSRDTPFCDWLNRPHLQFSYPCKAADFVEANIHPASGRLINEFNWGGYLEWRLGPHFQTLLDGRTQLFNAQFWQSTLLAPDQATKV